MTKKTVSVVLANGCRYSSVDFRMYKKFRFQWVKNLRLLYEVQKNVFRSKSVKDYLDKRHDKRVVRTVLNKLYHQLVLLGVFK